jgi:hypothetical protein
VAGIAGVLLDELIESEQPLGSVTIPISTEASVLGNSATGSMFGSLFASDGGQGLEEDTQIRIGDAATFSRLRIRVTLNQLPRFC